MSGGFAPVSAHAILVGSLRSCAAGLSAAFSALAGGGVGAGGGGPKAAGVGTKGSSCEMTISGPASAGCHVNRRPTQASNA